MKAQPEASRRLSIQLLALVAWDSEGARPVWATRASTVELEGRRTSTRAAGRLERARPVVLVVASPEAEDPGPVAVAIVVVALRARASAETEDVPLLPVPIVSLTLVLAKPEPVAARVEPRTRFVLIIQYAQPSAARSVLGERRPWRRESRHRG